MKTPPRPVVRRAARVLLLDPDGRVLLVQGGDPSRPEAGTWWFTPGGGLEAGESEADAAVREAEEETGHRLVAVEGPVARRTAVFPFDGRLIEQREAFFTARVPAFAPHDGGWTELERRSLTGLRWWTRTELRGTTATVFPADLLDLLQRVDPR